jgi:hypothetical protein
MILPRSEVEAEGSDDEAAGGMLQLLLPTIGGT